MHCLHVALGARSYPIIIGRGLLSDNATFAPYLGEGGVLVVTNDTVAPLYLSRVVATIGAQDCQQLVLPDGEEYKTLDTLNRVFDSLLEARRTRDVTLVALGGGVIGDLTGFAAACYQRGVDFIQVPTTLLAQVDSSVGGKTAVNHRLGKNMIGAFHQPKAVFIDTDTLASLPDRQFVAGIAEVIKYGLIADTAFFEWLEANIQALLARDHECLVHAIETSCRLKAKVVSDDERESGIRAILNLGHTFGHAIETHQGYKSWLHGEAIAAGMVLAARVSAAVGWLSAGDVERITALITAAGLPVAPPGDIGIEDFLELMAVDKKARGGRIHLVLLKEIGNPVVTADYDQAALRAVLSST
ncbi:MAG TPA: 3-dehydroquinate synthase [Porticoccaceae bacterium]|nr:3-dehydroquinate synthase [Porticoccaceae bacterium]